MAHWAQSDWAPEEQARISDLITGRTSISKRMAFFVGFNSKLFDRELTPSRQSPGRPRRTWTRLGAMNGYLLASCIEFVASALCRDGASKISLYSSLKLSFCASLPWWGGSTFHIIRSSHTRVDLKGIDPIPLACRHPQVTVHRNSKRIVPSRQGCLVFDLVTLIRCYLYHAQTLVVIISQANVQYFGLARRKEKHEINLSERQRVIE